MTKLNKTGKRSTRSRAVKLSNLLEFVDDFRFKKTQFRLAMFANKGELPLDGSEVNAAAGRMCSSALCVCS